MKMNKHCKAAFPWTEKDSQAIRCAPAYNVSAARQLTANMSGLRDLTRHIHDEDSLYIFGPSRPSGEAAARLQAELDLLTEGDHDVSLIMADITTLSGAAFHSAVPMCAQSTVKAPYVYSILQMMPDVLWEDGMLMHDAVVFSDNRAYRRLYEKYGSAPLEKWCAETGVDPGFAKELYPRTYTARDMFRLWTRLYAFLNSGEDETNSGAWLADTSASAARKQLGGRFPVQTKAGWESGLPEELNYDPCAAAPAAFTDKDPSNDECAINDSGAVYTDCGPYLFVIYTDHPFGIFRDYATPNPLYGLTEALYETQRSIAAAAADAPEKAYW